MSKTFNQTLYDIAFDKLADKLPTETRLVIYLVVYALKNSKVHTDSIRASKEPYNLYDVFKRVLSDNGIDKEALRSLKDSGIIELPRLGELYMRPINVFIYSNQGGQEPEHVQKHVLLEHFIPDMYKKFGSLYTYLVLVKDMHTALLKSFPKNSTLKKAKVMTWVDHITQMVNTDGRSIEDIKDVFEYAHTDKFWKANILSPGNLRDKFDKIQARMDTEKEVSNPKAEAPEYMKGDER